MGCQCNLVATEVHVAPSGVTEQGTLRGNEQALLPQHPPYVTVPSSPPATESFCAVPSARRSLRELEEFIGTWLMRPGERPALPAGLHASVRSSVWGWDGYRAVTADSFSVREQEVGDAADMG